MTITADEKYLRYALAFKQDELNFRDELMTMLPRDIIDCHAHCNLIEHACFRDAAILSHPASTFSGFSLDDSKKIQKIFYPGKVVKTLRFPIPLMGIDFRRANEYLLFESGEFDRVAVCGVPDDVGYTTEIIKNKKVIALKMYSFQFIPHANKIYQFFKPEILTMAEKIDIPIILHVPSFLDQCMEDLVSMLKDFPRLRVVLAHLGNPNFVALGLKDNYRRINEFPNVYLDTSLVPCRDVIDVAFEVFGFERIMFGSDEPFHLLRAMEYSNPKLGPRLITEYPYHWVDKDEHREYKHLARNAVHLHWLSLSALVNVIKDRYGNGFERVAEKVFHDNAKLFFGF